MISDNGKDNGPKSTQINNDVTRLEDFNNADLVKRRVNPDLSAFCMHDVPNYHIKPSDVKTRYRWHQTFLQHYVQSS